MSEWRTIDTAPRDGTRILVLNGDGHIYEAWRDRDYWEFPFASYHGCGCCGFTSSDAPTHWMPLPEPPETDDQDRDHRPLMGEVKGMTVKTNDETKVIESFIISLVEDMEGCDWSFVGIVEVEEYEENGVVFGRVNDSVGRYEKQDDEFIRQWTGYLGDDYSGFLLKPLSGNKYVKIRYAC